MKGFFAHLFIFFLIFSGCHAKHSKIDPRLLPQTKLYEPDTLQSMNQTIQGVSAHWDRLEQEIHQFNKKRDWKERGYFNAGENDALEALLFRFLTYHTALWDLVHFSGDRNPDRAKVSHEVLILSQFLRMTAELMLAQHTAFFVREFASDPQAIAEINETHYRSGIPFGTYDKMRGNITASQTLEAPRKAKTWYEKEKLILAQWSKKDPSYQVLVRDFPLLIMKSQKNLKKVHEIFPSHEKALSVAEDHRDERHLHLYAFQSVLFKDVSRLKNPTAHLIRFSDQQKNQIYRLLQPGDLILTYTAGYASDVFIPGAFKHGITFVGTPEQRKALGLSLEDLPAGERYQPDRLIRHLEQRKLTDGQTANMIEAVAEGVIFNNLTQILDTHINRMLVLRPQLPPQEHSKFIVEVFSYLGDGYDFRFDFSDASLQVCTEVIYRALNEKGSIDFPLTVRHGHPTLSADDIANYYLNSDSPSFEFVLLAEENPKAKDHGAKIYFGKKGKKRLIKLMAKAGS